MDRPFGVPALVGQTLDQSERLVIRKVSPAKAGLEFGKSLLVPFQSNICLLRGAIFPANTLVAIPQ